MPALKEDNNDEEGERDSKEGGSATCKNSLQEEQLNDIMSGLHLKRWKARLPPCEHWEGVKECHVAPGKIRKATSPEVDRFQKDAPFKEELKRLQEAKCKHNRQWDAMVNQWMHRLAGMV